MTADLSVLRAAILAALPVDPDDGTVVIGFTEQQTPLWGMPEDLADALVAAVRPVLDDAYRAGREAALDREEWRVVHKYGGSECGACWSNIDTEDEARRDLAQAISEGSWGACWIEHRRVGVTEWEQVES